MRKPALLILGFGLIAISGCLDQVVHRLPGQAYCTACRRDMFPLSLPDKTSSASESASVQKTEP